MLAQELQPPQLQVALFYPLFVLTAILCAIYVKQQLSRHMRLGRKIPGPPIWPFIGNAHEVLAVKDSNG